MVRAASLIVLLCSAIGCQAVLSYESKDRVAGTSAQGGASGGSGASGLAGEDGAGLQGLGGAAGAAGATAGAGFAGGTGGGTGGSSGSGASGTGGIGCNNGKKDGAEECDQSDFGDAVCATLVSPDSTGTLACTSTCTVDASGCSSSTAPSCAGGSATCGLTGNIDCCSSALVTGGVFNLGCKPGDADNAPMGLTVGSDEMPSGVATVSSFRLDRFEVTVARFRRFVDAYDAWRGAGNPAMGSGKHSHLPGGGLNTGAETGWDSSWDTNLPATASMWGDANHLSCSMRQTWTPDNTGGNENRPINCVSWYHAYAFCIWDEGFLPTEAEWEYAAAGGAEERVFPWSSPANSKVIDCSYANYLLSGVYCEPVTYTADVGKLPRGNGRYLQADLAGNVFEWTLDWYGAYPATCIDCASLQTTASRTFRSGSYFNDATTLRAANRNFDVPVNRGGILGIRCARTP